MGIIVRRKKSLIHDTNDKLKHSLTGQTFVQYSPVNPNSSTTISNENYYALGCCTTTSQVKFPTYDHVKDGEWLFVRYNISNLPSLYRDKKYLLKWIEFINDTFEFSEIHMISYLGENMTESVNFNSKIKFTFDKLSIYFAIRKQAKFANRNNYNDLLTLSLLRYISSSYYQFMVYDTLRLRKLKSLSDLSNWDILNIAKFGAQLNDTDYESNNELMMLYYYRSPLYLNIHVPKQNTLESLHSKLKMYDVTQNLACSDNTQLNLDVIYLMNLFQKKQYRKLFNTVSDKKHIHPKKDGTNNFRKIYGDRHDYSFNALNNRTNFNPKTYESTL